MSYANHFQRSATVLQFRRGQPRHTRAVRMAGTIELYAPLYSTPPQMVLLLRSWLFTARRDGMAARNPEYIAALTRAIGVVGVCDTLSQAVSRLRQKEMLLEQATPSARQRAADRAPMVTPA